MLAVVETRAGAGAAVLPAVGRRCRFPVAIGQAAGGGLAVEGARRLGAAVRAVEKAPVCVVAQVAVSLMAPGELEAPACPGAARSSRAAVLLEVVQPAPEAVERVPEAAERVPEAEERVPGAAGTLTAAGALEAAAPQEAVGRQGAAVAPRRLVHLDRIPSRRWSRCLQHGGHQRGRQGQGGGWGRAASQCGVWCCRCGCGYPPFELCVEASSSSAMVSTVLHGIAPVRVAHAAQRWGGCAACDVVGSATRGAARVQTDCAVNLSSLLAGQSAVGNRTLRRRARMPGTTSG
jgi:hypothetical protein